MTSSIHETGQNAGASNSAVLSPCGLFRYRLERDLGGHGPTVAIFGVNPSTADATINDQTIRKDIGFGARHKWGRLIKGNKFALRSTDVKSLRYAADPIGPENDNHIEQILRDADLHIVAWGPLEKLPIHLRSRWRTVARIAAMLDCPLYCFGVAQDGHPRHTLMISYDTALLRWMAP